MSDASILDSVLSITLGTLKVHSFALIAIETLGFPLFNDETLIF